MLLTISGGYTLDLSDKLDGIERLDGDNNRFTGKKHDGFFEIMVGLSFIKPPKVKKEPKVVIDKSLIDSDGDGLSDWDEINIHGTDPFNKDSDGDGLSDGDEILKYKTDPLNKDTDGDGLTDGDEVLIYKTDPLKKDTDGDGLSDGDEVLIHKTDPLKIDTDGGGMNDGAEVRLGKDPLDPSDDLFEMVKGQKVILHGITFKSDKSDILPVSITILEKVRESLAANPDVTIIIMGHTDSQGAESYNQDLSLRRAQSVKNWLVKNNIKSSRIKVEGKGELDPVATNDTADGRATNRRIEFIVE